MDILEVKHYSNLDSNADTLLADILEDADKLLNSGDMVFFNEVHIGREYWIPSKVFYHDLENSYPVKCVVTNTYDTKLKGEDPDVKTPYRSVDIKNVETGEASGVCPVYFFGMRSKENPLPLFSEYEGARRYIEIELRHALMETVSLTEKFQKESNSYKELIHTLNSRSTTT
jgi:hypothetical protein